jgi:hypothetical protein
VRNAPDGVTSAQIGALVGVSRTQAGRNVQQLLASGAVVKTHANGSNLCRWTTPDRVEALRAKIDADSLAGKMARTKCRGNREAQNRRQRERRHRREEAAAERWLMPVQRVVTAWKPLRVKAARSVFEVA